MTLNACMHCWNYELKSQIRNLQLPNALTVDTGIITASVSFPALRIMMGLQEITNYKFSIADCS